MKKILIVFLFTVFYGNLLAQNQEEVIVEYKIKFDKDNFEDLDYEVAPRIEKMLRQIDRIKLELHATKQKSKFFLPEELSLENDLDYKTAKAAVGANFIYYTGNDRRIKSGDLFGKEVNILLEENSENWIIGKEKKKILGHECYLAETTTKTLDNEGNETELKIKAWFTPEISIQSGPFAYGELPGLILEFSKNPNYTFTATSIELNPEKMNLSQPKSNKVITQNEYEKMMQKILKDIQNRG